MTKPSKGSGGFTIVELVVALVIISMIVISMFGLYYALLQSAILAKRKAVALTLATNQVEYLKSLPYNSLAVAGGSIVSSNPLPASTTQTISGVKYIVKTSIGYVDDAFDGCGSYPTQALKQIYCRNYPPPSGAPAVDQNPADYKIINVAVYDRTNNKLVEVDTEISARVAETASNTGALFVKVIDDHGNPVSGATVQVVDNSLAPAVNVSDSTDSNGEAIFYALPPDTIGYHYNVTASMADYSTLTTIVPAGSLQPNYPNQQLFSQLSSTVTLIIKAQGADSLLVETTDVNGSPLSNAKIYIKGGYKKYNSSADTQYYYDNLSPSDTRPVSGGGLVGVSNIVPGTYIFCGDNGATSCSVGGTTYYLAAAVPYYGSNALNPIDVPTYLASSPPSTTFPFDSHNYLQKVRLMLTANPNFPRVTTLTPSEASQSSGSLNAFAFQITGSNLPCSASAGSCATTVKFTQGSNTFTAACTGSVAGISLNCTVNLSSATVGSTQMVISANGNTLTLPASPLLGGINVSL